MKTLKIILALLFFCFCAKAQVNIDSLQNVLVKAKTDSQTLEKYLDLMNKKYSENLETQEIIGNWVIKNANGNQKILAETYKTLGLSYEEAVRHKEATNYLTKAISIAEKNNYPAIQCRCLIGLARVFIDNEQQREAIQYSNQALEIAQKNNLYSLISLASHNLSKLLEGLDLNHNKDTLKKIISLRKIALKGSIELNNNTDILRGYVALAETFSNYKHFDSAFVYLNSAKKMITKNSDNTQQLFFYAISAKINKEKGEFLHSVPDFKNAIILTLKSLDLAQKLKLPLWKVRLLKGLGEEYKGVGDNKNAVFYYEKYIYLHDSLTDAQNFSDITEIKAKYETQKKETQIVKLNAENEQKSNLNKILLGSTLGLLLLAFLGYRNFRNRQKLQQSKINELEKDKQLQSVDAMLKGQEDERNRIAKDLHDGLGGMLSGVKMSFTTIKDNLIMSAENVGIFEQSLSQLDITISELRKIAHNLMPEALVRFGLNDAIKDFCTSLMSATHINIIYENLGENRKLDNTANTYIYRIIQELINNAVKHGNPKQILVQMTTTPSKILITVEDDGKGIDTQKQDILKGIGITNIEHRVNYFKGSVTFENLTPQGTAVNIELNV
jgi:two-component system, NarL family, sensor kinase